MSVPFGWGREMGDKTERVCPEAQFQSMLNVRMRKVGFTSQMVGLPAIQGLQSGDQHIEIKEELSLISW